LAINFREEKVLISLDVKTASMWFLFIILPLSAQALPSKNKAASSQKIISEVEKFLLEKKRDSAVNRILQDFPALSADEKKQVYPMYLKASRLFYLDRIQQNFESLLQLKKTDLPGAQVRIQELISKEPHHVGLIAEDVRMDIQNNTCKAGLLKTEQFRKRIIFDEEINLMHAFSLFCVEKLTDSTLNRLKKETYDIEKLEIWKTLEGLIQIKALENTSKPLLKNPEAKAQSSYPEHDYFLWKLSLATRRPRISTANTYLESCRSISGKQLQDWGWDPFLCRRTAEVESDLAKLNKKSDSL
jgi:hypothetical protein